MTIRGSVWAYCQIRPFSVQVQPHPFVPPITIDIALSPGYVQLDGISEELESTADRQAKTMAREVPLRYRPGQDWGNVVDVIVAVHESSLDGNRDASLSVDPVVANVASEHEGTNQSASINDWWGTTQDSDKHDNTFQNCGKA